MKVPGVWGQSPQLAVDPAGDTAASLRACRDKGTGPKASIYILWDEACEKMLLSH
jgi:hypothetical protein